VEGFDIPKYKMKERKINKLLDAEVRNRESGKTKGKRTLNMDRKYKKET
jgi:hypothetical protein